MKHNMSISAVRHLVIFLAACLLPATSLAVVFMETHLASGNIVQIFDDNSVKLNDGVTYTPSRENLSVTVQQGKPVTLRYVVNHEGKKLFFDFAPGLNSLQPLPQISKRVKDDRPK